MNHLSRRCHRGGDGRGRGQRRPDEVARDAHGVAARRREHELHLDRVAVDVGPLEGPRVDEVAPLAEVRGDGDGVGRTDLRARQMIGSHHATQKQWWLEHL